MFLSVLVLVLGLITDMAMDILIMDIALLILMDMDTDIVHHIILMDITRHIMEAITFLIGVVVIIHHITEVVIIHIIEAMILMEKDQVTILEEGAAPMEEEVVLAQISVELIILGVQHKLRILTDRVLHEVEEQVLL